jgi:hypothetical protein
MWCAGFLPPTPVRGIKGCIAFERPTMKPRRTVVPVFATAKLAGYEQLWKLLCKPKIQRRSGEAEPNDKDQ